MNSNAPNLQTDDDLLQDQLNFFRASEALPELSEALTQEQRDEHHLSFLEDARNKETPTSSVLEPVKERKVAKRSRSRSKFANRKIPPHGFPQSTSISTHQPKPFAKYSNQQSQHDPEKLQLSNKSVSEDVRTRIAAMSVDEIRAAQQEIYAHLQPDTIKFLKDKWRAEHQSSTDASPVNSDPNNTVPPTRSSPNTTVETSTEQRTTDTCKEQVSRKPETNNETIAETELIVPEEESMETNEEERNKRLWMADADVAVPSQKEVDDLVGKAVEKMGDICKTRFELTGLKLSDHDVESLPTHLGLHHHGSSPASAGYTLPDILLLTRSTVAGQRVLALQMLKAIISRNGDDITIPLLKSGCLSLAFSSLPTDESFDSSVTSQVAYLEAVEVFVQEDAHLNSKDLVNGLYFSSRFYSPKPPKSSHPVFKEFARSDCVRTLIGIARTAASQSQHSGIAQRALNMVRLLLVNDETAAQTIFSSDNLLSSLKNMIVGDMTGTAVDFMLACDVLSLMIVRIGWIGGDSLERLKLKVIEDSFVHGVSGKLMWLLNEELMVLSEEQSCTARGVVRFLRASLTFQRGNSSFSALIPSACRLVRDDKAATETYLTLEAYAHSLFVQANSDTYSSDAEEKSGARVDLKKQEIVKLGNLINRQLAELVPLAISASSVLVDKSEHTTERRAAAGHFAATVFALNARPVTEDFVARTLNECSASTREISNLLLDTFQRIHRIRVLASFVHACARMLTKIRLELPYVERELDILQRASQEERILLEKYFVNTEGHAIANCCCEWVGLYSRVCAPQKAIKAAFLILPCVTDARVLVDLLSRTVLNVKVLSDLSPTVVTALTEKWAADLLPVTLTYLTSSQAVPDPERDNANTNDLVHGNHRSLNVESLFDMWASQPEAIDSFLGLSKVLFASKLLHSTTVFECLLKVPQTKHSYDMFRFLFEAAQRCVASNLPLIDSKEKTTMSTLSTTKHAPLAESVVSLCDFLVSRGPLPAADEDGQHQDYLASVLLSLMCGADVTTALRELMWKKTVDECGGAAIFENAQDLLRVPWPTHTGRNSELEELIRWVGAIAAKGYLSGERCPPVFKQVIVSRLCIALSQEPSPQYWLDVLAPAPGSRHIVVSSIEQVLSSPVHYPHARNIVSSFLERIRSAS